MSKFYSWFVGLIVKTAALIWVGNWVMFENTNIALRVGFVVVLLFMTYYEGFVKSSGLLSIWSQKK